VEVPSTPMIRSSNSTAEEPSKSRTSTLKTTASWSEAAATARTTAVLATLSSRTLSLLTVVSSAVSTPTTAIPARSATLARTLASTAIATRATQTALSLPRSDLDLMGNSALPLVSLRAVRWVNECNERWEWGLLW
jgi:hypothetical protein